MQARWYDPASALFASPDLALMGEDGSITSACAYEPYGEMEEGYSAEGTPFLYQDDCRDPSTDLYQMQARWYDPQAALFTSPDPAMGDATDPTLRYPYAYCAGDPVYNADPSAERLIEGEGEGGRMITWAPTSYLETYTARRGMRLSDYYRKKTIERKINYNLMRARAKSTDSSTMPQKYLVSSNNPDRFKPDYDRELWHHNPRYIPRHEDYPNTYTMWDSVAVSTGFGEMKSAGAVIGSIFLVGAAVVAYRAGQQDSAAECAAAAGELLGQSVEYSKPTLLEWRPYFYAPREGRHRIQAELSGEAIKDMGCAYDCYTKEQFKQYPRFTDTVATHPPGTRVVVHRGLSDFLSNSNPQNVQAYAYPPYYSVNEQKVINDMSIYPSFVVQPDGSMLMVNDGDMMTPNR